MNLRTVDIAKKLSEWLDRYAVPMHLRQNPKAAQAEAEALARLLCKYAPAEEYQPFLNQVFGVLDSSLKHRVWPTCVEMGAACVNTKRTDGSGGGEGDQAQEKTPAEIIADRMKRREGVPETYLYGISAVEMIAARLVDEDTMTAYRSAAFFQRKELYGEEPALKWEAEAKERHAIAKEVYRHRDDPRGHGGNIPNKRVA